MATHVERSIEVGVPVRTAYDQWTQFEEFPRFMSGVQEVRQVSDTLTHWVAEIGGVKREWDAAILEQVPDQKVAWAATTGATNAGAVYFTAAGADRTMVRLTLDFEPEGLLEKIADILDIVDRQAVADLDRFKEYIESRGAATGGWRGEVDEGGDAGAGAGAVGAAAAGGLAGGVTAADASVRHSGRVEDADRPGDVVDVGPTGGTRSTLATDEGSARTGPARGHEGPGVGHSGDPVTVDAQRSTLRTDSDDAERTGAAAGAGTSGTGVAGFGTDTGLRSDDVASGVVTGSPGAGRAGGAERTDEAAAEVLTGYPGERTPHRDTGAEGADDPAAGVLTGYPGENERPADEPEPVGADESGRGFVTGYPGESTASRTEAGAQGADESGRGFLTGYPEDGDVGAGCRPSEVGAGPGEREHEEPTAAGVSGSGGAGPGERWSDEPGGRPGTTGATTDPVGESWSDDAGARSAATGTSTDPGRGWDDTTGAASDPAGESWAGDPDIEGRRDRPTT